MAKVHEGPRPVVDLARAAQAGDRQALDELISGELPGIYNVVGRALNRHADVDDVVQETLIQIMRSLPQLRDPERFRAWALAIANRQVQMHLRSRRKNSARHSAMTDEPPDAERDFAQRTVDGLLLSGQRRELAEAGRWLDDDQRLVLSLWWQEATGDISRTELATTLGVTQAHAAVRVKRMKDQLEAARVIVRVMHAGECEQLAVITQDRNGTVDSVWRKRMIRHTRDCRVCAPQRRGLLPPERLLPGLLCLPLPLAVAAAYKTLVSGYPMTTSAATKSWWQTVLHHKAAATATTAALMVGGGLAYTVFQTPLETQQPPVVIEEAPSPVPGVSNSPTASAAPALSTPTIAAPVFTGVSSADIYVAPDGDDAAAGSEQHPYATIAKAVSLVRPGQTIALRGGTYRPSRDLVISTSGDAQRRITLSNYRNEKPVIDGGAVSSDKWLITHQAGYWTVQGLEIKNSRSAAYVCVSCRHNVFRRLSIHDNVRAGLMLRDAGTVGNQVLDSDFFNQHDPAGGRVGVGLAVKFGSGAGNVLRGNRAFNNADNGIDLGAFTSPVTVEHNWSYGNGVAQRTGAHGFTLGGGDPAVSAAHELRDNAAWGNAGRGFFDEGNAGAMRLTDNTAWRNAGAGFSIEAGAARLSGNVAVGNGSATSGGSWSNAAVVTAVAFQSTTATAAQGVRRAGGKLPVTAFLVTTTGVGASMRQP